MADYKYGMLFSSLMLLLPEVYYSLYEGKLLSRLISSLTSRNRYNLNEEEERIFPITMSFLNGKSYFCCLFLNYYVSTLIALIAIGFNATLISSLTQIEVILFIQRLILAMTPFKKENIVSLVQTQFPSSYKCRMNGPFSAYFNSQK